MKKSNKKIPLILIILVIFSLTLIVLAVNPYPNLEFSASGCKDFILPQNKSELGIREVTWLDDTTVEIKSLILANCVYDIKKGGYIISGEKIILTYKTSKPIDKMFLWAACTCPHELTYKISEIPKKDYEFEVKKIIL